jgi:hypothetical protein
MAQRVTNRYNRKTDNEEDQDMRLLNDALQGDDIRDDPHFKEKYEKSIKRAEERIQRREGGGMSLLLKLDIVVGGLLLLVFYFFITRPPTQWTLQAFAEMLDPRNWLKPR